jgi:hypothetical protein
MLRPTKTTDSLVRRTRVDALSRPRLRLWMDWSLLTRASSTPRISLLRISCIFGTLNRCLERRSFGFYNATTAYTVNELAFAIGMTDPFACRCAPTLTYQIAFPRTPTIRWFHVIGILLRMVIGIALITFLVAQVINPALASLLSDLEETNGTYTYQMMADYWLRLSVANTYVWLIMFYVYFHLYLNLFAELLRFGDRVFYKDWWNSSEVSAYWRLWNCPVHYWLIRHVYFPCIRMKMSRGVATFLVFFLSAVLHEVLVSVPFHMIRPWSFFGMMMQIPLVALTKYLYRKYPGSIGNMIFWLSFCVVGQPMAVFLYAVDYQYGRHHAPLELSDAAKSCCRVMWQDRCIIR